MPTPPTKRSLIYVAAAASLGAISMGVIWSGGLGWGSTALWVLALSGLMIALWLTQGGPPASSSAPINLPPLSPLSARGHRVLALGIILLGAALRVYRWDEIPAGIWSDELLGAANGVRLLENPLPPFGTLPLVPEWPLWVPTFNLYSYFAAGVLWLFGVGHAGVKALSILPGILALPALYCLGRGLRRGEMGAWMGAFATLSLALSRWGLTQSRFEWDATCHITLVLWALAALAHGLKGRIWWLMALGGGIFGLAQFTYLASRLSAAGAIAGLLLAFVIGLPGGRRAHLPGFAAFALAFGLAASPVIYTSLHDEDRAKARIEQLQLSEGGLFGDPDTIKENLWIYARALALEGPTNARQNIPRAPLLPRPILALALIGGLLMLHPRSRVMGLVLWGVGGASMLGGVLSNSRGGANAHRIGMVLPVLCAWVGLGAGVIVGEISRRVLAWRGPAWGGALWGLGGAAILAMGLPGTFDYFTRFGSSQAHWRAMGSGPQLHLAKALAPFAGDVDIWIDSALKDRTFDLLLYRPPGDEGGGLEDPPFEEVHISPRALLPQAPEGRPLLLALHAKHRDALLKQVQKAPIAQPLDPFGRPMYTLYRFEPGELDTLRHQALARARATMGDITLFPGDLQGAGLLRLERLEHGGPVIGAEIERGKLLRDRPSPPHPATPKPMEWHGHLYISSQGEHIFTRKGRGPGGLYIDGDKVKMGQGIHLEAGPHAFRLTAPGGRYNRVTLFWQRPGQASKQVVPMSALRPRLPRGFKLHEIR